MRRNPGELEGRRFQLVVVGGGIFGIALARDAALRGLAVALVEKSDFMSAASGNSYRMVHGGIRYLQHGDVARVRASSRERAILLATAPHLVAPLPIVIPTHGHGIEGRALLRAGIAAYDALTRDRNRNVREPSRRLPAGRSLSRDEVLDLFPGVEREGLTGGAMFADAQLQHPQRLGLAMLRDAVDHGAVVANYVEASAVTSDDGRVTGVEVRDVPTGARSRIEAETVVVAAGAWTERFLSSGAGIEVEEPSTFSRDLCLVLDRPGEAFGVAVLGGTSDPDAVVSRSKRHLFVVPWRGRSIAGVWHLPYERSPDGIEVREDELAGFIEELNAGYPGLALRREELSHYNTGLVLFGRNRPGARDLRYGHRSRTTDHGWTLDGLYSLIGVRYTTARAEAESLVDRMVVARGWSAKPCETDRRPVPGGDITDLAGLAREVRARRPAIDPEVVDGLIVNYGAEVSDVLGPDLDSGASLEGLLPRLVRRAVRDEMALRLADVVVRRTDLGLHGCPADDVLSRAASLMAAELGWGDDRTADEIAATRSEYPLA